MLEPLSQRPRPGRGTRRTGGLTLLELVMVLAVLAVLSSLALPSMGERLERQRALGAAQSLAADVAEARFEAARRGQVLFVRASGDGAAWCWAVSTDTACDCREDMRSCQLHRVSAQDHRGVALVQGLDLRVDPAGSAPLPQPPQSALLQTRRGERLRVDVSALGRARVCAVSGTWPRVANC